ncbi:hypothetical protein LTR53_008646 [Teratosphaeriaceae sp. CCFEE 6253]|nr:hypothetical protein LTR53_008646 [Teratosphaeriaceae sp. CCFEE 6253]
MLSLDFTGAANVADVGGIDGAVRKVILSIINSMFTLPNRFLVNLDTNNDYFHTYLPPLGIIRVMVGKAWGFAEESKGKASRFLSKLTRSAPDSYANVSVGAEEAWKTTTKNNTTHPTWDEIHDFVVTDFDQCITVDVEDEDVGGDDEIGLGVTTVREALLTGNMQELALIRKGHETGGRVTVAAHFFKFEPSGSSFAAADHRGDGRMCGLVTILIASAFDLQGARKDLKPSVLVTWGAKHRFQTVVKEDAPGTDISNPRFDQNFRIPLTQELAASGGSFRIALLNVDKEVGGVDVPFADVARAPNMTLQNKFGVGGGATIRASIALSGVKAANMDQARASLPDRSAQAQQAQARGGAPGMAGAPPQGR